MKVIDAEWEKRNLGIISKEICIETNDDVNRFYDEIADVTGDYIVVRVPSFKSEFIDTVQDAGFRYVEDIISVTHDLHEVKRNRILQRLYDVISYRRMNEEDISFLFEELNKGVMDSDRISTDSNFSKEQSIRRYVNWARDLIDDGALPYVMLYKDIPAGFIILKTKDGVKYDSVLGGAYSEFRNRGTGMVQKEQEIVKGLGGKAVETAVSSNNVGQVKALMENGYVPYQINHIFVKHNK